MVGIRPVPSTHYRLHNLLRMNLNFPFVLLRAASGPPRDESINVGLVAWPRPGEPDVRLHAQPARLRALHPNLARIAWNDWPQQLQTALRDGGQDTDTQRALLALLAQPLVADRQTGTVSAAAGQEDTAIVNLMQHLVHAPASTLPRAPTAQRTSRLVREVRDWLRAAKLYSTRAEDLARGRVVGGYPVSAAADLYADFALKNGAVHVIETLDLREVEHLTPSLRGQAALKGITLDEARERLDGKRIALVQASNYTVARPAIGLLGRYADQLWNLGESADRQAFAGFVAKAMHADQLPGF